MVESEQSYRIINTIVILELRIDSRTARVRARKWRNQREKKREKKIRYELSFTLVRVKKTVRTTPAASFADCGKAAAAGSWERIISFCHVTRSPAGRSEKINPLRARGMLLTFSRKSERVATTNRAENIDAPQGSVAKMRYWPEVALGYFCRGEETEVRMTEE